MFKVVKGGKLASMGPRSVERGKRAYREMLAFTAHASMGPRSVERGKMALSADAPRSYGLQWGRVLLNAES